MASVVIPTFADGYYTFTITLEEKVYRFDIHWNSRMKSWIADILDENDVVLANGMPIHVDSRIIGQLHHIVGMMTGELTAFDTTNRELDAGLNDLGTRVLLMYHEAADVAAI
jgi:hypothetical protein